MVRGNNSSFMIKALGKTIMIRSTKSILIKPDLRKTGTLQNTKKFLHEFVKED